MKFASPTVKIIGQNVTAKYGYSPDLSEDAT
jgi:hypothetical protein